MLSMVAACSSSTPPVATDQQVATTPASGLPGQPAAIAPAGAGSFATGTPSVSASAASGAASAREPAGTDASATGVTEFPTNGMVPTQVTEEEPQSPPPARSLDSCEVTADGTDPCACGKVPVPCEDGSAGPHACKGMTLLSQMLPEDFGAQTGNDVWGYVDPDSGREVAVVGLNNGTAFVDVTHPVCPELLGKLDSGVRATLTRDVKVFKNYALVVAEASNAGMQVFDLNNLFADDSSGELQVLATYRGDGRQTVSRAHNLAVVDGSDFVYIVASASCGGGLHIVNMEDPAAPSFAGCYDEGRPMHDAQCVIYAGPDADHTGKEICVTSNGGDSFSIVDMSDKSSPTRLGRVTYEGAAYSHQGWLTEDHRYFLLGDELDEMRRRSDTKTFIFDVSDLDNPTFVKAYQSHWVATDHNLYIHDGRVFEANYTMGVRVLDVGRVASGELEEVAYFDTFPEYDTNEMNGAWTAYPYLPSGLVVVNGMNGFFLLQLDDAGAMMPAAQ